MVRPAFFILSRLDQAAACLRLSSLGFLPLIYPGQDIEEVNKYKKCELKWRFNEHEFILTEQSSPLSHLDLFSSKHLYLKL